MVEDICTQRNNQLMTLKTELPTNLLVPLSTIQQQTQNILPTRIYRQLKYTANDNKLPTTVSVSEENFSLAEKIKSVPVHFKDKMYQYILSQNRDPPTLPLKRNFDATNP
jgi:hypothetical protein